MKHNRFLSLLTALFCAFVCTVALSVAASAEVEPLYILTGNDGSLSDIQQWYHWESHSTEFEYDEDTKTYFVRLKPEDGTSAHQIEMQKLNIPLPASVESDSEYVYFKMIARTNISNAKVRTNLFRYYETEGGERIQQANVYDADTALAADGKWHTITICVKKTGYRFVNFFIAPIGALRGNTLPNIENAYYDIAGFAFFKNEADALAYDLLAACQNANALDDSTDKPSHVRTARDSAPSAIGQNYWSTFSDESEYDSDSSVYYYRMTPNGSDATNAPLIEDNNFNANLPATVESDSDYAYMKMIVRTNITGTKARFVMHKYYETENSSPESSALVCDAPSTVTADGTWQTVYIKLPKTGYKFSQFFLCPLGTMRGADVPGGAEGKYYDIAGYAFFNNEGDALKYNLLADCKDGGTITDPNSQRLKAKFVITPPTAGLTPISKVVLTGGANKSDPIGNVTASSITWEPSAKIFDYGTVYTATLTLSSETGESLDPNDLTGLIINEKKITPASVEFGNENKTVTVKVTFPATRTREEELNYYKPYLGNGIPDVTQTSLDISFRTSRDGKDASRFHPTVVKATSVKDPAKVYLLDVTENGTEGTASIGTTPIPNGAYDISVKKQGYLEVVRKNVVLNVGHPIRFDLGNLIPGDITGRGTKNGDGVVNLDDFIVTLRAFDKNASDTLFDAANIDENDAVNVSDLALVKSNFRKTYVPDAFGGRFENTYYKLTVDKKLTVGYLGGSIVQGSTSETAGKAGFIDRMHAWFAESFPDAEIHSINAGISNTGSNFGIFRLKSDMMERDPGYVPDLVFLEFCVNDFGTFGQAHIEMLYESLIRDVYAINPNCDIVCLLTAMQHGYNTQRTAHIKIARKYDLPVLDLGTPMSDLYELAGDVKVVTNDNLHPNSMGYELYYKIIKDYIGQFIIENAPAEPKYTAVTLPEPEYDQLMDNPAVIPMTDNSIVKTGSWTSDVGSCKTLLFSDDKTATYLMSGTKGDTLTFTFEGNAFGVFFRKSADMGMIEFSVDGGSFTSFDAGSTQATYTHFQTYMIGTKTSGVTLTDGRHTVTIRVKGEKSKTATQDGAYVSIAGIFYNATK